jgi:hypothetical protein
VVSPTSPTEIVNIGRSEIQRYLQGDREVKVDERTDRILPNGSDSVIVIDTYRASGQSHSGEPFKDKGHWTAVDLRKWE